MFPREQKRLGVLDAAAGVANVDAGSHVFLSGQNADPAAAARLLQRQLLQRGRHVAVALVHQPDHRVAGADPPAAVHRRPQHDRPPVARVPLRAPEAVPEHLRRRVFLAAHHRQTRLHRHEHPPEVPRPLLSLLHGVHGAADADQSHQHTVRRRAAVVRRHQQVVFYT